MKFSEYQQTIVEGNDDPARKKKLEKQYGQLWDTDELQKDFSVIGFGGGLTVVKRKKDGQKGSLDFTHDKPNKRYYHSFQDA